VRRVLGRALRALAFLAFVAAVAIALLVYLPMRHAPSTAAPDDTVIAGQGWGERLDAPLRQAFYWTPQGASLARVRYDWLVHLERPWSSRRFAEPEHLRGYGFVVDSRPTPANPAQLPVGFARRYDPAIGEAVVDLTCAACHTGQLVVDRQGRRTAVRVDGAGAAHAFTTAKLGGFVPALTASLAATYFDPLKFRRFGRRVLGEEAYARGKWQLHEDLGGVMLHLARQAWEERRRRRFPVEEGFGRTDALARAAAEVFVDSLGPQSATAGGAPVRYPPLWNAWKLDRLRQTGSASHPMQLAIEQSLGAGASLALLDRYARPVPADERYRSSVQVEALARIGDALQQLQPPRWPEAALGRVDRSLAEKGRALFEQNCRRCHGPFEADEAVKAFEAPLRGPADPFWLAPDVPLEEIGTDPSAAEELDRVTVDLRRSGLTREDAEADYRPALEEYRRRLAALAGAVIRPPARVPQLLPVPGAEETAPGPSPPPSAGALETAVRERRQRLAAFEATLRGLDMARVPVPLALGLVGRLARERYYRDRGFDAAQRACLDGFGALDVPPVGAGYRARPLAGAWAQAPYLHNGSVPTLYQLLSPQAERDVRFRVVPGAFDPVRVGLDPAARGDGFWFDTRLAGNSNVGHEFRAGFAGGPAEGGPQYGVVGPFLTPEERWALVEYLKVHEDPATPPGRTPPACVAR
jgi:mono/diheme cytochrome c family protein